MTRYLAAIRPGQGVVLDNVLACDKGGTSFDPTLIRDGGRPQRARRT